MNRSTLTKLKEAVLIAIFNLAALGVSAQTLWTVSNIPGANADFSSIQAAIDAASPGDIIYVEGSPTPYAQCTVNKKLHFVGAGFFKTSNNIPGENQHSTRVTANDYAAAFFLDADSIIVEGFDCRSITISANDCVVRYNRVCCHGYGAAGDFNFHGTPVNALVYANYLHEGFWGSAVGAKIFNNIIIIGRDDGPDFWTDNGGNVNCIVQNNALGNASSTSAYINNCTFRNNIVAFEDFAFGGTYTVENNLFVDDTVTVGGVPTDSLGNGNIDSIDLTTVWNLTLSSPDAKYMLIGDEVTNPAFGAGINGEDCGPFGGNSRYILSGIVPIPSIYQMIVPVTGDTTNMLNVKIKAKSN